MLGEEEDLPFDIRNEVNPNETLPTENDEDQRRVIERMLEAKKKSKATKETTISNKEFIQKLEEIKIKFSQIMSKYSELHNSYDNLITRLDIERKSERKYLC